MFLSIEDRKSGEAERRADAVDTICVHLLDFARDNGGRFILYGSAAAGAMRYDSDIDLLIDFPDDVEAEAWRLAERLAGDFGIAADIQPITWCEPSFLERVTPGARVIG